MNKAQEKDIIRTLVKAGKEPLAKRFARSRGYRVRAGKGADGFREAFIKYRQQRPPYRPGEQLELPSAKEFGISHQQAMQIMREVKDELGIGK